MAGKTSKKSVRVAKKPAANRVAAKPTLLAGGNPQIAKADGDAPVEAFIAAMPGWKRELGKRLDALIVRNVPNVRKAVKWNSPMYGIKGQGWFLSFHVFTFCVKVTFFRGTSLRPVPPVGTSKDARWIDIHEANSTRRRWRHSEAGGPAARLGSGPILLRISFRPRAHEPAAKGAKTTW